MSLVKYTKVTPKWSQLQVKVELRLIWFGEFYKSKENILNTTDIEHCHVKEILKRVIRDPWESDPAV